MYGLLSDPVDDGIVRAGFSSGPVQPLPLYRVMTRPGVRIVEKYKDPPYSLNEVQMQVSHRKDEKEVIYLEKCKRFFTSIATRLIRLLGASTFG